MSGHTGDGNPSTHGATGNKGAQAGNAVKGIFSSINQAGEQLRGQVNSFADSLGSGGSSKGPGSTTTNETSTGMSRDAEALGGAVKEGVEKLGQKSHNK